eukprot:Nk52_evm4s164 gene=Nk52_evmTU4s164
MQHQVMENDFPLSMDIVGPRSVLARSRSNSIDFGSVKNPLARIKKQLEEDTVPDSPLAEKCILNSLPKFMRDDGRTALPVRKTSALYGGTGSKSQHPYKGERTSLTKLRKKTVSESSMEMMDLNIAAENLSESLKRFSVTMDSSSESSSPRIMSPLSFDNKGYFTNVSNSLYEQKRGSSDGEPGLKSVRRLSVELKQTRQSKRSLSISGQQGENVKKFRSNNPFMGREASSAINGEGNKDVFPQQPFSSQSTGVFSKANVSTLFKSM